jgi:hypothetical protein
VAEVLDARETGGLPDFLSDPVGLLFRHWRWMLAALLTGFAGTAAYVGSLETRVTWRVQRFS